MSEYSRKAIKFDKDKPISVNNKIFNSDIAVKPDKEYWVEETDWVMKKRTKPELNDVLHNVDLVLFPNYHLMESVFPENLQKPSNEKKLT